VRNLIDGLPDARLTQRPAFLRQAAIILNLSAWQNRYQYFDSVIKARAK
jgi:hypothetical protein